jgi:hypothetical protein
MNTWLLLHRASAASAWITLADYPTQAEARADGAERAKSLRVGDLALAQIQAAFTTVIAVTLTPIPL